MVVSYNTEDNQSRAPELPESSVFSRNATGIGRVSSQP